MIKTLILLFVISLNLSCSKESTITEKSNQKLLYFKNTFIAEDGDSLFESNKLKAESRKIEVKYLNDIIYVSYVSYSNACANYIGNIEIINDSIQLKLEDTSEEVCTSQSINRFTYIINNFKEERFKFKID